jgi:hypothetical protein
LSPDLHELRPFTALSTSPALEEPPSGLLTSINATIGVRANEFDLPDVRICNGRLTFTHGTWFADLSEIPPRRIG